ncbi:Cysteine-rich with EGF-like domain protein 2 [Echinococcus granulosus]|nr:Cysteine-rich with EGF-like domain protein 2 [Echinococcus granulosus]
MIIRLFVYLAFLGLSASVNNCDLCRNVFEKYRSAFYDIDPDISLGGGNTDWEEKFIGKYAFSELHAFETMEKTLKALNDREAQFLSEIEGEVEDFWVDYLKTGLSNLDDVIDVFCIEKLKLCCPWNKFGEKCSNCDPCIVENGHCDGNGTRNGTGICLCRIGFSGKSCDKCDNLTHFQSSFENGSISCSTCHPSCAGGCSDATSASCISCAKGFTDIEKDGHRICVDIDECAGDGSLCKVGTFCVNSEGSFSCVKCPKECLACTNPSTCLSCLSGYTLTGTRCVDVDECSLPDVCSGLHQRCVNKPGSYLCVCEEGYRLKQGVCVPATSRRSSHRHSSNKWNSQQSKQLLIEFFKLVLILVIFGVILYFNSSRSVICASLAVAAISLICYQATVLDALYVNV